jgi:hypothetical protein
VDGEIFDLINSNQMWPIRSCRQVLLGDQPTVQPPNVASPVDLSPASDRDIVAKIDGDEILIAILVGGAGGSGPILYSIAGGQFAL